MVLQRTYPDFGITPSQYIPADIDLAELAARLNSVDSYRREGRVLSVADFSPGMDGWQLATYGILSTAQAYKGMSSAYLYAPFGSVSDILKVIPVSANPKTGLSCSALIDPTLTWQQGLTLKIVQYEASLAKYAEFNIDFNTGDMRYKNSGGTYTTIYTDITLTNSWYNFKVVVDFSTNKYLRFYYDNIEIAGGQDIQQVSTPGAPKGMIFYMTVGSNNAGAPASFYVDAPVITMHEY